jgi:hypothetical protein
LLLSPGCADLKMDRQGPLPDAGTDTGSDLLLDADVAQEVADGLLPDGTDAGDGIGGDGDGDGGDAHDGPPPDINCTAGQFVRCDGSAALYCGPDGHSFQKFDCGNPGCLGTSGCGQCDASTAPSCTSGVLATCDPDHQKLVDASCVTLGASAGSCATSTDCQPCSSSTPSGRVCGDGQNYGTTVGYSYDCVANGSGINQMTGPTFCAFGCDPQTGGCSDMVPASQAADPQHLGSGDTFSCFAAPSNCRVAFAGPGPVTVTFDTDNSVVTATNQPSIDCVKFGSPYTPVGAAASVVVAHVGGVDLPQNSTIKVIGSRGLILISDGNVDLSGTVTVAAALTVPGPGAPSPLGTGTMGESAGGPETGSGGAGHASLGGAGGAAGTGTVGAGGNPYGTAAGFALEAGSTGANGVGAPGSAGAGGGVLQISSCTRIHAKTTTLINASGGGAMGETAAAGSGGGSGGTLILEAPSIEVASGHLALAANGGGGGGGNSSAYAQDWQSGPGFDVTVPAHGGPGTPQGDGVGGDGATSASPLGACCSSCSTQCDVPAPGNRSNTYGGGGGGALGRIYLITAPAIDLSLVQSSPVPVVGKLCGTQNGVPPAGGCRYSTP